MAKAGACQVKCLKGLQLKYARTGIFGGWRWPLGWLTAYVLVFQLVLGAVAGAQFSAQAAGQNWSFFEICYGKGSSEGELPSGKPDKQASKSFGCVVCANAVAVEAPHGPSASPVEFSVSIVRWSVREEHFARTHATSSTRQRAPPFEA